MRGGGRLQTRAATTRHSVIVHGTLIVLVLFGLAPLTIDRDDSGVGASTWTLMRALRPLGAPGPRLGIHDSHASSSAWPAYGHALSRAAALAAAQLAAQDPRTLPPRALSALAAVSLVRRDAHDAIALLEPALRRAPASVDLAATLTAAYYVRGGAGDRARAFEQSYQALDLHPHDPILLFNAAFLAESLLPRVEARAAWQRYVSTERNPSWRAVGMAHIKRLSDDSSVEAESSDPARLELLDRLLPAWATACLGGTLDEPRLRARIQSTASRGIATADRFFTDLLSVLAADTASPCREDFAALVAKFARGRAFHKRDELRDAEPIYRSLASEAVEAAPPLALEAALGAATAGYFGGRRDAARIELDRTAHEAERRGYFELLGRVQWMRGYTSEDESDHEAAVMAYEAAGRAFARARSADGIAAADGLVAWALDSLGDYDAAWRRREIALGRLSRMTDSRTRGTVFSTSIRPSSRDGFQRLALRLAHAKLNEESVARSASRRMQALIEVGDMELAAAHLVEARAALDQAAALLPAVGSATARARLEARVLRSRAATEPDPMKAALHLGQALALYQTSGADIVVAELLLARARSWIKAGKTDLAEADLRRGISVIENVRATLRRPGYRLSYFDEVWDLFDELLDIVVARGDLRGALELSEQARGRVLRDALARRDHPSEYARLRPSKGVRAVGGDVLVYYLVLRDRLVTWVFQADRVSPVVQSVKRDQLSDMVRQFSTCTASATETSRDTYDCGSSALTDLLLAPVLRQVGAAATWTIVADPVLQPMPFAALRNPMTGRFLVEDVTLSFAPTLESETRSEDITPVINRALVVGDPSAAELPRLPQAGHEARTIARLYPDTLLLTGPEASREAFLERLPTADLVHVASHARVDPEVPDLSRLLLAADADQRGAVYAHEIAEQTLTQAPIVVLAACETSMGRTYRSEGTVSLARAFLHAGARTVVATLWPIDDRVSGTLFVELHRELRRGTAPARALQRAQVAMLTSADPRLRLPAAWAASINWTTTGMTGLSGRNR